MKRFKCFLSMALCLTMLISSLPMSVFAVGSTTETSFEGYIPISTKEDLNAIRNDLSAKYYLTNNIVFSEADFSEGGLFYNNGNGWDPIGTSDKPFTGVFDGNGYAIVNLCINITCDKDFYIGLFGYTKCSEIKNLACYSSKMSIATTETEYIDIFAGGIVGYNDSGIIENCYNYSDILITYKSNWSLNVGGIAGGNELWKYNENAIIKDCNNYGNISVTTTNDSSVHIGGIVASNDECEIESCNNKGAITVDGGDYIECGGIVGTSSDGFYADNISNCSNSGQIDICASKNSILLVGGISGSKDSSDGNTTQCFNNGDVIACGGSVLVGGIIGDNDGDIVECYNSGSLSSSTGVYSFYGGSRINSGGIAGSHDLGNIKNCFNSGNTIATCNVGDAYVSGWSESCFGGIVGSNSEIVSNSYNVGTFSVVSDCKAYCGGIIGYNNDIVSNCYFLEISEGGVGYNTQNGASETKQCSTAEMEAQETYLDFDFDNIWEVDKYETYSYPTLKNVAYSEYGSGSIPDYPPINYTIKFGLDRFNFGEDITGSAGDVIDSLVVYTSANENIASLDITSSNTDIVEIGTIEIGVGDYITSENEHMATIPLKLKAEGTSTITITSPEGVSENVKVTVSKAQEVKKSIAVFTTEKSLSVNTGDSMWLAFGLMNEDTGLVEEDWRKMAITVSDPTIIALSDYEETEYGYSLEVIGKKEGSTNVTITDTETGINTIIVINVLDSFVQTYSYAIDDMKVFYPNNQWEDHIATNIYNLNGIYVNNYQCIKNGSTYNIDFDVYNSRYYAGSVDIYDESGMWLGYEEIVKYSDVTSLWSTGEQAYYLISNTVAALIPGGNESNLLTYEQESFSKHTHISLQIPEGGYFTISNNVATSPGTFFINAFEILFDGAYTALDLVTSDSVKTTALSEFKKSAAKSLADRLIEARNEGLKNELKKKAQKVMLGTMQSEITKITKKFAQAELKDQLVSTDETCSEMANLAENILSSYNISWKHLFQTATGVGESFFSSLSGPAGAALKGCFAITKSTNKLLMATQMATSTQKPCVTVYSKIQEGYINPYGVIVNTAGNMDAEAVLQVFRVSNDDAVDVILNSNNPLEKHELYNICFVKDDQLVQPSGKVTVHIPIPEGMNSNTCKVYRQESDGAWTILDAHIEGNYLVFETDHFSLYSVIGDMNNLGVHSLPNKVVYTDGDTLDTTGLLLNLNGELISEGFVCEPMVLSGAGNLKVTVRYGNATADFDVKVKAPGGYIVSGSVLSFGEQKENCTLRLIDESGSIETLVTATGNYSFENIAVGTYTLEVSKANHVTRTCKITVTDEDVVQDVKIHLLGDINGDGLLNIMDVNRANAHAKKRSTLTGYDFACADINGDGAINIMDVNRMNAHAKKRALLW